MFDKERSDIIWVSSDSTEKGNGTWERPFCSIETGLNHVQPGYTLVIKDGVYKGNLTIQVSGTAHQPVRITSDENAVVTIENGCWFLYDTSDLIISNLIFKNAPYGAISVVGKCHRNRFESLQFNDCGTAQKASCTLYFGGSGGENNIVEDCIFKGFDNQIEKTSIALMISEGDLDEGAPLKNFIIRKNVIRNYGYGMLIGSSNQTVNLYGHIVEYNSLQKCITDGILVKCGDTIVRGNCVENCKENSISLCAGTSSVIDSNRIVGCGKGIRINGAGHSVVNNCIIQCHDGAIHVSGSSDEGYVGATNLFIESNTFVRCGHDETNPSLNITGIKIDSGTSCIIQKNLIYGHGLAIASSPVSASPDGSNTGIELSPAKYVINDNISSYEDERCDGVIFQEIEFTGEGKCFENTTGYGASGWVCTPQTFDPNIDTCEDESDYVNATVLEDENGELIIPGENDPHDLFDHLYGQISGAERSDREE